MCTDPRVVIKEEHTEGHNDDETAQDLPSWVGEFTQTVQPSLFAQIVIDDDDESDDEEEDNRQDPPPNRREEGPVIPIDASSDTCAARSCEREVPKDFRFFEDHMMAAWNRLHIPRSAI